MKFNMFARLKVWQKLSVLVVLLLFPIGVLVYLLIAEKNIAINFAQSEIYGVDYLLPVHELALNIAKHRGTSFAHLNGNARMGEKLPAIAADIEHDLAAIERKEHQHGALLASREKWQAVKDGWSKLKGANLTAEESFRQQSALLSLVLDLYSHVGDTSNLILDPDLDSYYLMDLMVIKLASLIPDLGTIGGRSAGFSARGAVTEDERIGLINMLANARHDLEQLPRSLQVAFKNNERLAPLLDAKAQQFITATGGFLSLIEREMVRSGSTLKANPEEIFAAGTGAIDKGEALYAANATALRELVEIRIAGFNRNKYFAIAVVVLSLGAALGIGLLLIRGITRPVYRLGDAARRFAAGDDSARSGLDTKDEFGELGRAFDDMIDNRIAHLKKEKEEKEQLNNSVLGLLKAVAQLARRDLTTKVPVTEDVTGPVADALNMLSSETAKVLQEVSNISADVTAASLKVKEQSDSVMVVAEDERREVEHTAESLAATAQAMDRIAELAKICNSAADNAIKTTATALQTVNSTVGGINGIRDTIRETEKRIKRLGERSQEISGVVNLINSIAERTHILALNASMHAASAGEAGRGFAVVADEVQRLAENARQATAQIATLVNNIQIETSDTVTTMNTAISQVVEGSKLAEQAGEQMKRTQETTSTLVASVQKIAQSSQEQAKSSNELLTRAKAIQSSSTETSAKLKEQTAHTSNLVEYAKSLLGAVRVFKLPS